MQADKTVACGTLAKNFAGGPVQSSDGLDRCPCATKHAGCPYENAGAAGAVFAQSFRTPLASGSECNGKTGKSWGRSEHGAMTHVWSSDARAV